MGDPFVPGYFFGEEDPHPMSSLPLEEYVERVNGLDLPESTCQLDNGSVFYDFPLSQYWFEDADTQKLRSFVRLHDRRSDSAVVGLREVLCIEIED